MGLLDRLFGRRSGHDDRYGDRYADQGYAPQEYGGQQYGAHGHAPPAPAPGGPADQQAIERYRYLLRSSPPDNI